MNRATTSTLFDISFL